MTEVDVLIVGAGVTGLASAAQLASDGWSVCILERHHKPGMETSTHNSGVIHAGLYYPPGTLKAELCVEGAARLYAFCAAQKVPHERCGKLVVATSDHEVEAIEALARRGAANGAEGLEIVGPQFIQAREPHIRGVAALWSPGTGRVEPEALMRALLQIAEAKDAAFLRGTPLTAAEWKEGTGFVVRTEHEAIAARVVVNAAGLYADETSVMLGGERFTIYPCRGEYAELRKDRAGWVNGLVYPVPLASGHGLGVHITKTLGGQVMFGPTARFQDSKADYENNRQPLEEFVEPVRTLLPNVDLADLRLGGTGIRPKLHSPGESFADFMIRADQGNRALIHAAGIESPGLTACVSIGARVASLAGDVLS